jgi:hypothetical protein
MGSIKALLSRDGLEPCFFLADRMEPAQRFAQPRLTSFCQLLSLRVKIIGLSHIEHGTVKGAGSKSFRFNFEAFISL